jgi:hypothetical protein
MLAIIIVETLVFVSGVAVGVFFRNQINAGIKLALSWGRKRADEVEKRL